MSVELVLGTVQFGLRYGIAGRGEPVPADEVRGILDFAWQCGIRMLDTAPAYGDIEQRLGGLSDRHDFRFVSKIPALPEGRTADGHVRDAVERSVARLGGRLATVLFHRGEDLLGPAGSSAWAAAIDLAQKHGFEVGASCYSPSEATAIRQQFPIRAVQLPGNALDQRLREVGGLEGVEVHLRSSFLQGLLLMSDVDVATRLPAATAAMIGWRQWCDERGYSPLQAALGVAKALPGVRYCVVGVDQRSHLEEIAEAWRSTGPLYAPDVAIGDLDIIDPRRWHVSGVRS